MVFKEPSIKSFISFSENIFSEVKNKNYTDLYLIDNSLKTHSNLPKDIISIIDSNEFISDDLDIKYLYRLNKAYATIVIYNRCYKHRLIELGSLVASKLDNGYWRLNSSLKSNEEFNFALGWGLNQYKFNLFNNFSHLNIKNKKNKRELVSTLSGVFYGKELINIPSSDMGPESLEKTFIDFAEYYGLISEITKGDNIKNNFPLIYAVGKASTQGPRLLEMNYNVDTNYPLITIVGKGVCFDTGGLNLKPSQYMRNMKKDMGGAASVLSLANIIIRNKLKIKLKVLIPAVDNDIGSKSMRPGDVYNSRAGLKVEIGNTDAEGRLILADTLTYADKFKPALLIDFATLTGAARVALGPDLPAYFTSSDKIANIINNICLKQEDPLWRLPLWNNYNKWLNSDVADTNNISKGSFAGSITAALFLKKFTNTKNWIHIDTYAWSDSSRPGHSIGGDILGVRSIYKFLKEFIKK